MSQNFKLIKKRNTIPSSALSDLEPNNSTYTQLESHYFEANNTTIQSLLEDIRRVMMDERLTGNITICYNLGRVHGAKLEISSTR